MPVDFDIRGKVIAITGAASGIGLQTAFLLASQGASLSLADVNEDVLKEKAAEIEKSSTGGKIMSTAIDVRVPKQVDDWIDETVKALGKLDGGK